jgi:hypothetical protein
VSRRSAAAPESTTVTADRRRSGEQLAIQRCGPHLHVVGHPSDPALEFDPGRFAVAVQDDPVAQYPAEETDGGAVEHSHLDPADAGVRNERVRNSRRHPFGISASRIDGDTDVHIAVRAAPPADLRAVQISEDHGQGGQLGTGGHPQRVDQLLALHTPIVFRRRLSPRRNPRSHRPSAA